MLSILAEKSFAILGAGMQGTAAAYDLARFAPGSAIMLGDASLARAEASAARVNSLVGREACRAVSVDALNPTDLGAFLAPHDVLLSCVPYWMHPEVAAVAINVGTSMCDLGGNTEITHKTLALDAQAIRVGVTLIPDTGLAPGLVNSIGSFLIDQFDLADTVKLYCGVLPQHPVPPFNYKLTFNIEGLLTEYDYEAVRLRDHRIELVETLNELEEIDIQGLGKMEAFTTSGGTSTAPYSFQDKVRNYEYKTIRFPGHCERMRIFKDFGFWGEEAIDVKGVMVRPRDLFYRVFGERLSAIQDEDQCIIRGVGTGIRNDRRLQIQLDIHDRQCAETGFTSMERTTGYSISIHAIAIASGLTPSGAIRYEKALSGGYVLDELKKRGIGISLTTCEA